ncbi:MAG TPA: rhodanese-like domain-containing protein [Thermoplasmata archaeon]|nr:rhodanese-like domain-containing protein [Thermoplasmata archaeon]
MVSQVSAEEAARQLKERPDEVLFLDVREPYERELATIAPSLHIPMSEVPARLAEIPKDREVIVYCHAGSRSNMVAGFLSSRGWKSVANLSGGIDAWSLEVDPTVPRYG